MKKILIIALGLFVCSTAFAQAVQEPIATADQQPVQAAAPQTDVQQQAPAVVPAQEKTTPAAEQAPASDLSFYLTGNIGLALQINSHGKELKESSAVTGGLGFGLGFADIGRLEVVTLANSITQKKQPGYVYDVSLDTTFVMCNIFLDTSKPGVSGPYLGLGVGSATTEITQPSSQTKIKVGTGTATAVYLGYAIATGKNLMVDLGIDYFSWESEKVISGIKYKADLDQFNFRAGLRWYFM